MPNYIDFHDHVKSVITKACYKAGHSKDCADNFQYAFTKSNEEFYIWHACNMCYQSLIKINSIIDLEAEIENAVFNILEMNKEKITFYEKEIAKMNDNYLCKSEFPRVGQDSDYKPPYMTEYEREEARIKLEYEQALADLKRKRDDALYQNFVRRARAQEKEMAEERAFKMKTRYDEFIKAGFDDKTAKELMREI